MIILVEGKEQSGKSKYAETVVRAIGKEGLYVATMIPYGEYGEKVIARHHKLREDLPLRTIESPYLDDLDGISFSPIIILEDISNLTANRFFNRKENHSEYENIIKDLSKRCENLIVVGMKGMNTDGCDDETTQYSLQNDSVMEYIESISDSVIEMVNGEPKAIKGSLPQTKEKNEIN